MDRPLSGTRLARTLALVLLIPYALVRLRDAEYWDLLDDVNLAIHEAGHLVFSPFGDHLGFLGGSLLQLIVPSVFVGYFWRSRQRFAAGITLSWVAVNLLYVSRYIGDARAQELPLLGGENAIHDWWYLLTEWDLLPSDMAIARAVHFGAALSFVLSAALALLALQGANERARTEDLLPARPSAPLDLETR